MAAAIAEIVEATVKPAQRLREYRCACGRLLVRARLITGCEVEAYCDRCKKRVLIIATDRVESAT